MSRTLKIFFMLLGLSIFVLPKQMISAQNPKECCDEKLSVENCCKIDTTKSCHADHSKNNSEKNHCGEDCTQCHSCTVHFVMNYLLAEFNSPLQPHFFIQKFNFAYGNSYFSTTIQNIWQPPKLS